MTAQSDCPISAQSLPKAAQNLHTLCVPLSEGHTVCMGGGHFVQYTVERKPKTGEWLNLRVVVPFKSARRDALHYHLAWNGSRWSCSGELDRFCQWYPEIAESLTAEMEAGHAAH